MTKLKTNFKKQFPSLKDRAIDGYCYSERDIIENCVDKERIRKTLKALIKRCKSLPEYDAIIFSGVDLIWLRAVLEL